MPLQKQTVMLNLAQSGNQKVDPKSLSPGTPTLVENARFSKGNRLDKRFGYRDLFTAQNISLYSNYFFSGNGTLDETDRVNIIVTDPGTNIETIVLRFWMSGTGTGYQDFATDVSNALSLGGGIQVFDKSDVRWVITGKLTQAFFGVASGDSRPIDVRIRQAGLNNSDIYKDKVRVTVDDFESDFDPYFEADSAIWSTNNFAGLPSEYRGLTQDPGLGNFKGIIGTENNLLVHAGDAVINYSETLVDWEKVGDHIPCETVIDSIDETGLAIAQTDMVHIDGISYYAFGVYETVIGTATENLSVWVTTVDESNGETILRSVEVIANVEKPTIMMLEFNGAAYLFFTASLGTFYRMFAYKILPGSVGSQNILFSDMDFVNKGFGNSTWDVYNQNDSQIVIAYNDEPTASATTNIRYFDGDLVELTAPYDLFQQAGLTSNGSVTISESSSGTKFFLLATRGEANSNYIIMNDDGTQDTGVTNIPFNLDGKLGVNGRGVQAIAQKSGAGREGIRGFQGFDHLLFSDRIGTLNFHLAEDGTYTQSTDDFVFDSKVISRPVNIDGMIHCVYYRPDPLNSSYHFGTILNDRLYSVHQVLFGRAPSEDSSYRVRFEKRNIVQISDGIYRYPVLTKDSIVQAASMVAPKLDFNSKELFTGEPYGKSVLIAGSNLHSFGGQYLREHGFFYAPRNPALTQAAGGNTSAGIYLVLVVYEFTDSNGYLHRSAPSEVSAPITTIANQFITVTVPNYTTSNMDKEGWRLVQIIPYRTTAGGSIFYREDYYEATSSTDPDPKKHENLPTVDLKTMTLLRSDDDLESSAPLFTESGEVAPSPIPPVKYLTTWGSRIWAAGSARDEAIFFSKINQTNLMPEFTELLSIPIQDKPGRTTGIQGFTDKIILSKLGRLFYSYGQGPNNLGGAGSFAPFEEILGVSGAVNGKSIVVTSTGLHYKTEKGYYTLGPGLNTVFSGAAYEDEVDQDIIVALSPTDTETTRFVLSDGILTYDNFFNTWSKDTSGFLQPVDAAIYNNDVYILTADKVLRETQDFWADDNLSYNMSVETGWISTAGLAGFQRLYKLMMVMDNKSPYSVIVSLAYDYGDFIDEAIFENSTDARIIIYPSVQKCEAFRIKIDVRTLAENRNTLDINFIGVVVGTKKGLPKQLQVSQRIGVTTI